MTESSALLMSTDDTDKMVEFLDLSRPFQVHVLLEEDSIDAGLMPLTTLHLLVSRFQAGRLPALPACARGASLEGAAPGHRPREQHGLRSAHLRGSSLQQGKGPCCQSQHKALALV